MRAALGRPMSGANSPSKCPPSAAQAPEAAAAAGDAMASIRELAVEGAFPDAGRCDAAACMGARTARAFGVC